jgi:hypothetical protein
MWVSKYPSLVGHHTFASGMITTLTSTHLQE